MNVLLVEDDANDAEFLQACLHRESARSVHLTRVASVAEAVGALHEHCFDVVLLDLHLPDGSGEECIVRIQEAGPSTPIVVLSGEGNEDYAVEILNRGVQDYLVKWEGDGRIILRSIRYAIERKRSEARLNYLARYDSLTKIPNRQYFQDQLERAATRARRNGSKLGLLFFDLDRFKTVNDTLGHRFGDELLKHVVQRLARGMRKGDLLARLGGDEFAVMLEDIGSPLELEAAARGILRAFQQPFEIESRQVSITASVGITVYPADNKEPLALLNNADIAMYQAKENGRNNFKFFTQSMHEEIIRYHQTETDLKNALDNEEFFLVFQPQVNLRDRRVEALEALLRWKHPQRGIVYPREFISVAEDSGYIIPIGLWVLERACKQLREWQFAGLPLARIAVNVAPVHFHQPDFHHQVERTLKRHGIPPTLIELELTEGSLMQDTASVQRCLQKLKEIGVRLSIDDFGTGHSCLNYLRKFPIHGLKIDRSFVADLGKNDDGTAICAVILSIARSLGLETVAEGVETELQLEFLARQGCELAQGRYFGMPTAAEVISATLLSCQSQRSAERPAMASSV